jgi:hypothetical protein
MSFAFNSKTFTPNGNGQNDASYAGPDKTVTDKDDIRLVRSAPKPTATFSGVAKVSAKLTRTLALTGALTPKGDIIMEISFSTPVGAVDADLTEILADGAAFLAATSAANLLKKQTINVA